MADRPQRPPRQEIKMSIFPVIFQVLFLVFCGVASSAWANLELNFDLETLHFDQRNGVNKKINNQNDTISIVLGDFFFSIEINKNRSIYDFGKRRIYKIDLKKKTYFDDSLFIVPGFRTHEFKNRLYLNEILKGVKKEEVVDIPIIEHELSLLNPDSMGKILRVFWDDTILFKWKDKELLSVDKNSIKVEEHYVKMFAMFLLYYLGGHPDILQNLKEKPGIPGE